MGLTEYICAELSYRLNNFLPRSSEFGFFLNPERFRQSALHPYEAGHRARPAPFLLYAVYLWGIRLSDDPNIQVHEAGAVNRALQESGQALSIDHPQAAMHSLQAEVLLAYYFFYSGRLLEGQYHAASASSLAISLGLHRMYANTGELQLPPSQDSVEDGERNLAIWVAVVLDKAWAIILDSQNNIACPSSNGHGIEVVTPWPLEQEDYDQVTTPSAILLFALDS
jgi:hypothetical protein